MGAFSGLAGLAPSAAQLSRRQRERMSDALRIQAALRAHADPGPELRERADQQAGYTVRTAWIARVVPLGPLTLLLGGDWATRPIAATVGAVLVVGAAVLYGLWLRVRLLRARRWVADPPGPDREAPPAAAERWMSGRRVAAVIGGVFLLGLVVGLVLALAG